MAYTNSYETNPPFVGLDPFKDEKKRIEFLFQRYQQLTAPLIDPEKNKRKRSKIES